MVKNIQMDETGKISGNNAAGLKIDILREITDIGKDETLEAFIERHGGIEKTLEYLSEC